MEKGSRRGKRPCAATPPIASPTVEADGEEKFYALLGSISAMRDLIRANKSKRQKTVASLPLWRPTFELEDFKEEDKEPGTVAGRGRTDGEEEKNENEHIHLGEVTFIYQEMTESVIANVFMEEKKNSIPLVINDSMQCSLHGKS
ncbi:unnamed protein product [Musa acuminata subsp. burmannicoides]